VAASDTAPMKAARAFSGRRRASRKILRFSVAMGFAGALLTALVYVVSAFPDLRTWSDLNLRALSEINCIGATCDTRAFVADWQSDPPDYVVDMQTGFLIFVTAPTTAEPGRFPQLDYSDTAFIERFREPASYNTPDGEVWRLYSRAAATDVNTNLEVIVGYAMRARSNPIATPDSLTGDVDATLKRAADGIARGVSFAKTANRPMRSEISVDGFQVVDPNTKRVVEQGPRLPAFLPKSVPLPSPGLKFYMYEWNLYAAETYAQGRLLATTFTQIGGLGWIVCSCSMGFICLSYTTHALSRRYLRNYFAVTGMQVPSLEEARRSGEGQSVEFKRGLSSDENKGGNVEDELLKSIVAFANTNDGVIFIGIDDAGHVKGLDLDFAQKDRLERKIRQLIRNRIKPIPPIQITFEDVRGLVIAKIAVASGEAPAYMIGGTLYVRHGSSDVQAQPEDLAGCGKRVLEGQKRPKAARTRTSNQQLADLSKSMSTPEKGFSATC